MTSNKNTTETRSRMAISLAAVEYLGGREQVTEIIRGAKSQGYTPVVSADELKLTETEIAASELAVDRCLPFGAHGVKYLPDSPYLSIEKIASTLGIGEPLVGHRAIRQR